jgi:hypothetical protein
LQEARDAVLAWYLLRRSLVVVPSNCELVEGLDLELPRADAGHSEGAMMIPSAHAPAPNEETLPAALAHAARRADWRVLAALSVVGAAGAVAIFLIAPRRWLFALPLVVPAMFGAWGLADRAMATLDAAGSSRPAARVALQILCGMVIAVGVVTLTVLAYAVTFKLAGPAPVL